MTKKATKVFSAMAVVMAVAVCGYLLMTPAAVKSGGKTYNGTLYVAGMGGHFAVVDVSIDPSNTDEPIKVNNLDKMDIGGTDMPTHDARIDAKDRNTMFWSTYKLDDWKIDPETAGKAPGKLHVGKSNLKTGEVIKDVAFSPPERAKWVGANYCASGQSEKYFMPISMANEGYIDVFDKATLELKHRVFLDSLGIKAGETTFAHGTNYPDNSAFLLTVNITPDGHTKWTGNTRLYKLDMAALENGAIKKLAEREITGVAGKTITFRQYFSNDGKHLFQSAADRGYLLDGETLKVLDEITPLPGANHDIIPTPDGKYAVMTLREKAKDGDGNDSTDGTVLLYDVAAKKTIGKSASVCFGCHRDEGIGKAVLCGLDANWK